MPEIRVLHLLDGDADQACPATLALLHDAFGRLGHIEQSVLLLGGERLQRDAEAVGLLPEGERSGHEGLVRRQNVSRQHAAAGWGVIRRFIRSCGPFDLVHAWSVAALSVAAVLPGLRERPKLLSLTQPASERARHWVRVLCDQAGSPGHAKAPIVLLPASATIRRGLLMRGVAEPAVHVLRPSIDLGRVRHQRRAALRERWQLDDDTPLIALISDPPEAADALEAVHSAGLVGEAMKRPVSLLVLPQQAGRWRAEQLLGPIPAPRYGHVQEPLADQPWAVLPGCDVALGIGPGAGGLSLLWAMAANVPIVAEATYAVSEIVEDRHSALLSTPGAGFALAHRITRLLEENRLAWELRDTARHEAFSLFSRRRYCESLGRVYRQLNAGEGVEIPPMQPTGGLRFAGRA